MENTNQQHKAQTKALFLFFKSIEKQYVRLKKSPIKTTTTKILCFKKILLHFCVDGV
jgi:hypothetical protein